MSSTNKLKFVPFHSVVDSSFFQELSDLKLNKFKLNTESQRINGYYTIKVFSENEYPTLNLSLTSFSDNDDINIVDNLPKNSALPVSGNLNNLNTKEDFAKLDKNEYLRKLGNKLFELIKTGEILNDPSKLLNFNLLSFSDLKKFQFFYWFSYPSLVSEWKVESIIPVTDHYALNSKIEGWLDDKSIPYKCKNFFLLNVGSDSFLTLDNLLIDDKRNNSVRVGIIDSSTYKETPSWYLRNFLTMLLYYGYDKVEVLIYRFNKSSFTLHLSSSDRNLIRSDDYIPRVTGWEKTSFGKLQPKFADLSSLISPVALADQSVDLNLKLMKWRIMPELNLDNPKNLKCLLLGAGTLGSYVSRALLGWGVRHITFVDNGKVSFSNPVRQSLYDFEDCLDGGKPKAEIASERLSKIFPKVVSKGYNLEIPMIGHPVKNEEFERSNFEKLQNLVQEHDAIFLLMDSRESRWLPTVLGNVYKKIVMNVALGFDSYLVMRHGVLPDDIELNEIQECNNRLGCYFCNDVVVPSDSLSDRTLDQMCTVTRPGVALIASAMAVELLVSMIQNCGTSKNLKCDEKQEKSILGEVPQQIRGFLHNFSNLKLTCENYQYCSGCSIPVLKEFYENGWEFVKIALNNSDYIDELCGLKAQKEKIDLAFSSVQINEIDEADDDSEWIS